MKIEADLSTARWQRSSADDASNPAVEIAFLSDELIAMRNSGQADTTALIFTRVEWSVFMEGVLEGSFDRAEG